ncbi:MAG: hypothetical protein JW919_03585 [Candidatus Omnitrophica bacterium]|nr:hypothetical protein [Candidatus Omnitrophota bacterium]
MKKIGIALIVIAALVIGLAVTKDMVAKSIVEGGVKALTGLKLQMGRLAIGIINQSVGIKELRIFNPAGFAEKLMLDMPEIYVKYDLVAFLGGKIHLPHMRIHMKEFIVEKNREGKLNLDSLKVVKEEKGRKAATAKEKKPAGKMPKFKIDVLELKIGKVIYKDYSAGGAPSVREFNVSIDERFENIDDPSALASVIIVKALTNTSVAKLADFDMGPLSDTAGATLKTATKVATQTVGTATKTVTKAAETAKQTTDALKGLFGGK